jgi:hypothetical protein
MNESGMTANVDSCLKLDVDLGGQWVATVPDSGYLAGMRDEYVNDMAVSPIANESYKGCRVESVDAERR